MSDYEGFASSSSSRSRNPRKFRFESTHSRPRRSRSIRTTCESASTGPTNAMDASISTGPTSIIDMNISTTPTNATAENDLPYLSHERIESTEQLILKLLKEDHDEFVGRQKGKSREGVVTDEGLALSVWDGEVQNAGRILEDRIMALSISNAMATDQQAIAALEEPENHTENDRAVAPYSNGTGNSSPSATVPSPVEPKLDPYVESFCKTLNRLAKQSTSQFRSNQSRESASDAKRRREKSTRCTICFDGINKGTVFGSACGHLWCDNCLQAQFLLAATDELVFPPRCCGNIFPSNLVLRLLDFDDLVKFCTAGLEFFSDNRTYCADASCSTFIPKAVIEDTRAECPACHKLTHTLCKALGEPDHECPIDESMQQVLALADKEGWKRCPKCLRMIAITYGCNHMTCSCGEEFCYECGGKWKIDNSRACKCRFWVETRLLEVAHRVVDNEPRRYHNAEERAVALAHIINDLHQQNDFLCQHTTHDQWRYSTDAEDFTCDFCRHILPNYIFICRTCQVQVCLRCKMTRFRPRMDRHLAADRHVVTDRHPDSERPVERDWTVEAAHW